MGQPPAKANALTVSARVDLTGYRDVVLPNRRVTSYRLPVESSGGGRVVS
jgi:hypothetical protein